MNDSFSPIHFVWMKIKMNEWEKKWMGKNESFILQNSNEWMGKKMNEWISFLKEWIFFWMNGELEWMNEKKNEWMGKPFLNEWGSLKLNHSFLNEWFNLMATMVVKNSKFIFLNFESDSKN